jgi:hypothetical protein
MEIPMKLTDTQLVLLSAASQREDGAIELMPNLKGAAAHKVLGKLMSEGLIEQTPARGSLPVFRLAMSLEDALRGVFKCACATLPKPFGASGLPP